MSTKTIQTHPAYLKIWTEMTQGDEYYFQGVSFQDENLQATLNINGQNC